MSRAAPPGADAPPGRGEPGDEARSTGARLRQLGSGLVTGVADDDPSAIGTYVSIGAGHGFGLLWAAVAILPVTAALFRAATRLGLVTGIRLGPLARRHLPSGVLAGCVWAVALANTLVLGADLAAMAAAIRLLVPVPAGLLVVLLAAGILAAEVTIPYHRYAAVLRVLALTVLAYPAVLLVADVDWGQVARQAFVPRLGWEPEQLAALVALLGAALSPYVLIWAAGAAAERAPGEDAELDRRLNHLRFDSAAGAFAALGVGIAVMVASAVAFGGRAMSRSGRRPRRRRPCGRWEAASRRSCSPRPSSVPASWPFPFWPGRPPTRSPGAWAGAVG